MPSLCLPITSWPFHIALAIGRLLWSVHACGADMMALGVLPSAVRTARAVAVGATELDLVRIELPAVRALLFAAHPPRQHAGLDLRSASGHFASAVRKSSRSARKTGHATRGSRFCGGHG